MAPFFGVGAGCEKLIARRFVLGAEGALTIGADGVLGGTRGTTAATIDPKHAIDITARAKSQNRSIIGPSGRLLLDDRFLARALYRFTIGIGRAADIGRNLLNVVESTLNHATRGCLSGQFRPYRSVAIARGIRNNLHAEGDDCEEGPR